MDLNVVLFWMALISGIALIVRGLQYRHGTRGWLVLGLGLVGTGGMLHHIAPDVAGDVLGGLWALTVLLPMGLSRRVNALLYRQQFAQARTPARLLAWLHPGDSVPQYARLVEALGFEQAGRHEEARAILMALSNSAFADTAYGFLCRIDGRWADLAARYRTRPAGHDVNLNLLYLRSLGETGDTAEMVAHFERVQGLGVPHWYPLAHFFALAFLGQREAVERLLAGPLALWPKPGADYWRATCLLARGDAAGAEDLLVPLEGCPDMLVAAQAARRRAHPNSSPQGVDPAQVAGVVADAEHHVRYAPARTPRNAVILLVVANVLMFSLELAGGGSMDEGSLMRLGALMPDLVVAGQAWRLLAAAFLHYGWLHLTMNMFALLVLGPYVESRLGSLRFLLLYLLVGVLDNALYVVLAVSGHAAQELLVGASGAIMGLVGVSAAIFLRGWRQEKSSLARRNLFNMVFLVGLQSVFDLNVPQVSFLCHILGVLTGFGLGWLASQGQTPA